MRMKSNARRPRHLLPPTLLALGTLLVSACGGSADPQADQAAAGQQASAGSQQALADVRNGTGTAGSGLPGSPNTPVASAAGVTSVAVQSTASTVQWSVPVSFGQVFAKGDLKSGERLVAQVGTERLPLQLDVKARHADGSVRHAVLSAVLPQLAAGANQTLALVKVTDMPPPAPLPTARQLLGQGFSTGVEINLGGRVYRASADELLGQGRATPWLQGPMVQEWLVNAPLVDGSGVAHPHLSARFAVRWYPQTKRARVDVVLENDWAYEPAPQNFQYDVAMTVGGARVYAKQALNHFAHARWRKTFWWGDEPKLNLAHDAAYMIRSGALPSYDTGVKPAAAALTALANSWAAAKTEPMGPGLVVTYMPSTGGRPDIAPLPQWAAMYLLSMDPRAKAVTLGVGDLAGSWPIHYRDKNTGRPVSLADYPYMTLLGRPGDTVNPKTRKSEAFPACTDCATAPYNYSPDSAHQPSLAYLPYVVTGDAYYLEELQFWANYNMLQANPGYRDQEKGLLKSDQIRGQAWSLRTLGQAAYITPDADPMKAYFTDRVQYNLAWYHANYVEAKPNALGILDGRNGFSAMGYTTPSGPLTGVGPWQDDFFTWSVSHLATGLGYASALPMAQWKATFPVGRMTAKGYCWIDAATYSLSVRPSANAAMFTTLEQAYQATLRGTDATGAAIPLVNSTGARYLDQPCGSAAQAAWRTQQDKDLHVSRNPWVAGEMTGYATSQAGYPSNMQPALAAAVDAGAPNAQLAWDIFMRRSVKPDYTQAPQWAIVPQGAVAGTTTPTTTPTTGRK
jgi:hypothetical protein